jgi:hypothetical protein
MQRLDDNRRNEALIQVEGRKRALAAAALCLAIAACEARPPLPSAGKGEETAPERAYVAPPHLTAASRLPGGRIAVEGKARAGAQVRLATPAGEQTTATADPAGVWRMTLLPTAELRLLGLSMTEGPRTVQAEGYWAITPGGEVAQLRSGAGADVLSGGKGLRITAVDFDRQGAAIVSGRASPNSTVNLRVDGILRQAPADAEGRFSLALDGQLAPGDHQLEAADGALRVNLTAPISAAGPVTGGPFRATRTNFGWRVDWMTPGGGLQSTLLVDQGAT